MGLGIDVGMLADLRQNDEEGYQYLLQQFAAVNKALQEKGLPEHHEPEDLQGKQPWFCLVGSYGIIHCLRRLAAHL